MASAVLAAILAELGLRAAGYSIPVLFRSDPTLGTALVPLAEWRWRHEGTSHVRINREAYRDRDHAVAKPPGTVRIAVLGRSDGFVAVTLAPALAAFATSHATVLHLGNHVRFGGGHWNATTHRVAGELLAQRLLADCVIDPGR